MKQILSLILCLLLLLSMVGCRETSPQEIPTGYWEFAADIYLCDDVYITDDTPTHGSGQIALDMTREGLEVKDHKLLLCRDNCDPVHVVSRASQGYAPVYQVVADGELMGNYQILKFKMKTPEEMVGGANPPEGNYYYLIKLDKKHYAYIHLERAPDAAATDEEQILADYIVQNACIYFSS